MNFFPRLMKRNRVRLIDQQGFDNLTRLEILELDDNGLKELPEAISGLSSLVDLSLSNNKIQIISENSFKGTANLIALDLRGNPLKKIDERAFRNLSQLRKLILSDARSLEDFPVLIWCESLELLRIDRARISKVPDDLCKHSPKLRTLDLKSNKLTAIPNLKDCLDLRVLDLANNNISSLDGQPFQNSTAMHDLLMPKNSIRSIPKDAFTGLTRLQVLDLEGNRIEFVHPEAFEQIKKLEDLNLGNNVFPKLPIAGLQSVIQLKTFNNPALRDFPPPERFPRVRSMLLSYAYHCCPFAEQHRIRQEEALRGESSASNDLEKQNIKETVIFPTDDEFDLSLWNNSITDLWPQLHNLSDKFGKKVNELWDNFGSDFTYPGNLPAYVEEYFDDQDGRSTTPSYHQQKAIHCLPQPGPFLPCEDLFDWWTLRCGVWIVFLLAMLGNGCVVFVLIFSRSKMDVPRFLVCNLAAADFFMGLYLGLLAVVDASTQGQFRKFAIRWQMSYGCQLAGFLGVLSSELSVFTLAVITLERNYAITHAMHLNKRLSLRDAGIIMSCGWMFALSMASLPLVGISDYRKFAICLPFETEGALSLAYVVFLMLINGVAFLILMGCYLKMYCAIRGSQAWNSNDSRIAKRMALLVFTDFLCWSPIAFFSLTAAFGLQLVSLEQAKVFAVFVLPLNSCCNPFLYAILTKQFKKDCVMICKAIEESRVNKGIGTRCRHNSNFSNRLTPANTNSVIDRSNSREHNHHQVSVYHQASCPCNNNSRRVPGLGPRTTTTTSTSSTSNTTAAALRSWWRANVRWPCSKAGLNSDQRNHHGQRHQRRPKAAQTQADPYGYQTTEPKQQKQHNRASSMSSSENYSSSRSDSWRQNHPCGIPLRFVSHLFNL
ncbi:hypothetical protein QAD02_011155 [Eretmocerus hayati]|uniref:Uncharacterized protein n=1 Tax=Eretmocerus hayati TaxID=131215 RepID=A0ACC2NVT0_9HYME|nr:hypothetical protein QAD02_011155 [Eretmocerus hayati]